jgi:phenylalanyl-tRNA synthetase beta chain
VVLEIGLTANRGDAASHLGVANDLAALLKQDFDRITHQILPIKPQGRSVSIADAELCQRYIALEIQGLQLGESPDFVKHRLRAIGIEPRNNVVDTTNYFLHQTGQPMHAFDADLLEGNLVVRLALADEKLVLLDGKSINLDAQDVVIADASGAIALAGVMGGLKTAVNANTKNILLEIAHFHPTLVRKSAKRHHLHTDAGFRFERGVDVENMANAASLAGFHLVEHCGGTWVANFEVSTGTFETRKINLNVSELNKFAGLEIPVLEIRRILGQLGFGVIESNNHWEVSVPGWRNDVSIAVDLYEEVMRIYGYDHVPMDGKLQATLGTFEGMGLRKSENRMRQYLINQGMLEASTNSLHPSAWYPGMEDLVYLSNPLSTDMDVMRASLTPGLLQSVAYNINRKAESVQLFEVGRTYRKTSKGFKETPMLSMVFWGAVQPESWESKAKMVDYYHVKRRVMGILRSLGSEATADNITIAEAPKNWLTAAEINGTVWCVEFPWRKFIKQKSETLKVVSAPKYPGMRRDLSLVVAKEQTFAELEGVVKSIKLPLLQDVRVFDVFEGKPLDAGQKAVALSFHFLNAESTLTDTEVDRCMDKLMKAFEAGGASIRK